MSSLVSIIFLALVPVPSNILTCKVDFDFHQCQCILPFSCDMYVCEHIYIYNECVYILSKKIKLSNPVERMIWWYKPPAIVGSLNIFSTFGFGVEGTPYKKSSQPSNLHLLR